MFKLKISVLRLRAVCMLLALIVLAGAAPQFVLTVSAAGFSDMPQNHWAYQSVSELVASGTINGFEDGTFRPDATVSRAEFVKMIGMGGERRSSDYADVNSSHWGYEYIMTSGLDAVGDNMFLPDTAINRETVANLLWNRNGKVTGLTVPRMITSQSSNPDAAAWVYAYGIMMGDDYINLRLGDSLTRAEAAALIVRAKKINADTPQIDFYSKMTDKQLETVYNAFDLIDDKPYNANLTVTHGELAMLAMRIATAQNNVTYSNYSAQTPFEHKYAKALYVYGNYCIGDDKVNKTYIDQNATVADAICAVMFGTSRNTMVALKQPTGKIYPELEQKTLTDNEKMYLSFAYENGVSLYANAKINADKDVTLKELACILLQCDEMFGFESPRVYSTVNMNFAYKNNMPVEYNVENYPSNADIYAKILKDVPKNVYETPFVTYYKDSKSANPKDIYNNCRDFYEIYVSAVRDFAYALKDNGVECSVVYIPSLVINNGHGYTYRLKINVSDNKTGVKLSDIIDTTDGADGGFVLEKGKTLYVDFDTNSYFKDVYMTADNACINKIVVK